MEFLNRFILDKRYVFDKDIYIEYMVSIDGYIGNNISEEYWINCCNNKEVQLLDEDEGEVHVKDVTYAIIPSWCREIPSIRLLTEKDML